MITVSQMSAKTGIPTRTINKWCLVFGYQKDPYRDMYLLTDEQAERIINRPDRRFKDGRRK